MTVPQPIQDLWQTVDASLPANWRNGAAGEILSNLEFTDALLSIEANGDFTLTTTISSNTPIELPTPGFGEFGIVLGETDTLGFDLDLSYQSGTLKISAIDVPITIYLPETFLKPVDDEGGLALLARGTFSISSLGDVSLAFNDGIDLTPCYIGERSGITVSASGMKFDLSVSGSPPEVLAAGFDESFVGIFFQEMQLGFPSGFPALAPQDLVLKNCAIGTSGVSGELDVSYAPTFDPAQKTFVGTGALSLFGFPLGLKHLEVKIVSNALALAHARAQIFLPYLDRTIDVVIGVDAGGTLSVALDSANGLATISIPNEQSALLDLEVDGIAFHETGGIFSVCLSGRITPSFGGLNWPSFEVKALSIDSNGYVKLEGGWLDLPKQYSLDFHGFKMDVTKFGFGRNDDGTKWIGMSGAVKLVEGLPAGVSVKGLRITTQDDWSNPRISFEGVGVEFEVPGVFQFKGEVDYREFPDADPPHATIHRFDGDVTLKLEAIDLEIDGTLVAGSAEGYNYLALYVDAELPAGIPLGPLPIAFFGFSGLLALQMAPNKSPADKWYGVGPSEGWFKEAPTGVEHFSKWKNMNGSRAFGAGVTLGTFEDNGYTFNGRVLLAVMLPGPTIVFQGMSNLLKERAKLTDEAMFRTIAVLDKSAGTLLFGVDATYQYDQPTGGLIKIGGGLEAFYNFNDPSAWHIDLGLKDPRASRIQARVLSLFDANAYLMLDAHELAMGAWIGYDKSWHFSKLSVALQAWMESNAIVSFKPAHLHGDLWMHGSVELKVFKFGAGLNVDARLAADVFKPFHLLGDFSVGIHLPRPLKNLSAHIPLEWGPRKIAPPRPIVFKEAAIEHLKSSVKWPMPLGTLTQPSYDDGSGFLGVASANIDDNTPPSAIASPDQMPRVPMDCRPSISFARNVWDNALVGVISQPLNPEWEWIGDPSQNQGPAKARYALRSVQLDKYDGASWTTVALASGNVAANAKLFGSWSATSAMGGSGPAQTKLLLWSVSGFDQFRNTSADWAAPFALAFPSFPCFPVSPPAESCLNFDGLTLDQFYWAPFIHPDDAGVMIGVPGAVSGRPPPPGVSPTGVPWDQIDPSVWKSDYESGGAILPSPAPLGFIAYSAPASISSHQHVLCPLTGGMIFVTFASPRNNVRIMAASRGPGAVLVMAIDSQNQTYGPFEPVDSVITIPVSDVLRISLEGDGICLAEICGDFAPLNYAADPYVATSAHNASATSLWAGTGNVLAPFTQYRLRVETTVETTGYQYDNGYNTSLDQIQYAYFRTAGPPGIGTLSIPGNVDAANFDSGLEDLSRYVEQTVPPTVPRAGEKPLLPRPVYRGYDVGVVFNENYVSQLYRMAGRDLSLQLYDRNNQLARDVNGRIAIQENPWDRNPTLTLSTTDQQWVSLLNASTCAQIETTQIKHNETIVAGAETVLLAPDELYEARLIPSLLHEDFQQFTLGAVAQGTNGTLGRWHVLDDPAIDGGPSKWTIEPASDPSARRLAQLSSISTSIPTDAMPPGSMLVLGNFPGLDAGDKSQPDSWTDFRLSLYVRSAALAPVGAVFRRLSASTYYAVVIDALSSLKLVFVNAGAATVLAQKAMAWTVNRDYHIVIEALGTSLRVYLEDEIIFDVNEATIAAGGIALYCSGAAGAAFSDIQTHDLSVNAEVPYKFHFTTSRFISFYHLIQSFEDGCWKLQCSLPDADFSMLEANAVAALGAATSDAEGRGFESFSRNALGQNSVQLPDKVEISKVQLGGQIAGFLVRGPQPFGFARNDFSISAATVDTPTAISPTIAKIVDATLHAATPQQEIITVMILEPSDLSGYEIEARAVPNFADPAVPLDDPTSQWTAIYTFPNANPISEGLCIAVFSCSPDTSVVPRFRTTQLFRAASGNPGTLALSADAVDLRLVSPIGEVVHARRFVVASAYQPVSNCMFLRKADETAFLVLPPGGPIARFSPGSYKINMAYRLDNRAAVPLSTVLSQAGNIDTEAVEIDFSCVTFDN